MKAETPMQDLRRDLVDSIESVKNEFLKVQDLSLREAMTDAVTIMLTTIIKRIDDELLANEQAYLTIKIKEHLQRAAENAEVHFPASNNLNPTVNRSTVTDIEIILD